MACSTSARILAWDRFTVFWPGERVTHRPRYGIRTVPPAPRYPLSAQQGMSACARASMMPCSRAARVARQTLWRSLFLAGSVV
jgi:hypothetical protein